MSSKHARLVAAVSDAKEAQGFTWKQIAIMAGVTQGTISCVINQGVTMKDERWKLICEGLGLDYDDIVADMPVERERFTLREKDSSESPQEGCCIPHGGECKESADPSRETRGAQMFPNVKRNTKPRRPLGSRTWTTSFCWQCMPKGGLHRTLKQE